MLTFLHLGWLFCSVANEEGTSGSSSLQTLRSVPLQCSLWIMAIQGISAFGRTVWMATVFSERQQLATKYLWGFNGLSAMFCSEHTCPILPFHTLEQAPTQSCAERYAEFLGCKQDPRAFTWIILLPFRIILYHFIIHDLASFSASFLSGLKKWIHVAKWVRSSNSWSWCMEAVWWIASMPRLQHHEEWF